MDKKTEFINIYKEKVKREGSSEFLKYLESTDFFNAPASSKFHSNTSGGLVTHSLNTYYRFKSLLEKEYGDTLNSIISEESIAIISLLHDVCKINTYKVEYRNVKVNGDWIQVPYYTIEDELPYGHGEKSVYMISGFMKLTREESMAINWHMGGFDNRVLGGSYSLSSAFYKFPVAVILHVADIMATYLDETIA